MNTRTLPGFLERELKFEKRSSPFRTIFEAIRADLTAGAISEKTAYFKLMRTKVQKTRSELWQGNEQCRMSVAGYLAHKGKAPRPQQNMVAILATRKANIITLYGESGTGKTTSAIRAADYHAITTDAKSLVAIQGTMLGRLTPTELSEFVEIACAADILILDDLDKGSKSETRSAALFEILDCREKPDHFGPTIITANFVGPRLAAKIESQTPGYGIPIANRMQRSITVNFDPVLTVEDTIPILDQISQKLAPRSPKDDDTRDMATFRKLDWRFWSK